MEAVTFIFFLAVFVIAIINIPFFKNSGLTKLQLAALFVIKVLAGIVYALFYKLPKYYAGADTWRFYKLSLKEKEWLLEDPVAFIQDLFMYGYDRPGSLFAGENSYWNDLKSNIPVKLMACMNVITNSSYYTNIIIFNFIFFVGLVALYKLFNILYPGKKWLVVFSIFLLPSTLFWCSGIHKDGLILSALGLIAYTFYKVLKTTDLPVKRIVIIALCLIFIFPLRNYVALALLPALVCWGLSHRLPQRSLFIFTSIYLIGISLFFVAPSLSPSLNFTQFIVDKQAEFIQLDGNSEIAVQQLEPTFSGFVKFFPTALDMALFRPHLTEIKNLSYLPAIAEILLFLSLIILFIFFRDKFIHHNKPLVFFCIFFGMSLLLIAGYTITFSGAIVRYRSLVFPLLFTPLICAIDWQRILPAAVYKKMSNESIRMIKQEPAL